VLATDHIGIFPAMAVESQQLHRVFSRNCFLLRLGSQAVCAQLDLLEMNQLMSSEAHQSIELSTSAQAATETQQLKHAALLEQIRLCLAQINSDLKSVSGDVLQTDNAIAAQLMMMTVKMEDLQSQLDASKTREAKLRAAAADIDSFHARFLVECERYSVMQEHVIGQIAQQHKLSILQRENEHQKAQLEGEQDVKCVKEYARNLKQQLDAQEGEKAAQDKYVEGLILDLMQVREHLSKVLDRQQSFERDMHAHVDDLEAALEDTKRRLGQQWQAMKERSKLLVDMRYFVAAPATRLPMLCQNKCQSSFLNLSGITFCRLTCTESFLSQAYEQSTAV